VLPIFKTQADAEASFWPGSVRPASWQARVAVLYAITSLLARP